MLIAIVSASFSVLLLLLDPCAAFITAPKSVEPKNWPRSTHLLRMNNGNETGANKKNQVELKSNNPLELAAWYGVEAFGKVFRQSKSQDASVGTGDIDLTKPPSSMKETFARIQLDNDRYYFLSGDVDRLIYDEDCVFADPFVSFNGRDRFIDNLSNLGSFITKYDGKMINYDADSNANEVNMKVMVKLELNLPWKPILAWPWGVKYEIDPDSYLVTSHVESWDVEPWEGVKQIFRKPNVKISQ